MNLLENELVDDLEYDNILEDHDENILVDEPVKSFSDMSITQSEAEIQFGKLDTCEHDQARLNVLINTMREVISTMNNMQKIISTMQGSFKQ
jgi:hypothetical protein